ncbi:MAG: hypothetical protein CVU05_11090, partial [Bacteroidetes bacterium HGW-Bacteroidetes-21]
VEGLAGDRIFSIAGDDKNNVWVGTDNGVSQFIGNKIINYTTKEGLNDNQVFKIVVDKDMVLVGTAKGVSMLKEGKFVPFSKDSLFSVSTVYSIYKDKKSRIWFGTKKNGLYLSEGNNFKRFTLEDSLLNMTIRVISEDSEGRIWIGTDQGFNFFEANKLIPSEVKRNTYMAFYPDVNGTMWLATYSEWLSNYTKKNGKDTMLSSYMLHGTKIRALLIDKEQSIWLGTETGLIQIPFRHIKNYNAKDGLHQNNVFGICAGVRPSEYWIGADAKGVSCFFENKTIKDAFVNYTYTEEESEINEKKRLIGSSISSILRDRNRRIWLATYQGITVFNATDSSFNHYCIKNDKKIPNTTEVANMKSNAFYCLFEDYRGLIWAGSNKGIMIFSDTSITCLNDNIPELNETYVFNIFQDKMGVYWFATQSGVMSWNEKKLSKFNKENGFTDGRVNTIEQDKYGALWFATKEGVFAFNGYEFKRIDKSTGLLSNNIYSLKYDGNQYIYIGSDKGMDKMDVSIYKQLGEIQVKHYSLLDGFLGVECNMNSMFIDSIGRVFVGTVEGFNIYDPTKERRNTVVPKTRINKLLLNFNEFNFSPYCDKIDSVTGLPVNLKLPYNMNHLSFIFASNSLLIPEKVMYRYKMVGIDTVWSPSFSKNDADYPTLQPGKYTFQVISCNNDGLWSDNPASFSFEISPPFYMTWWFITTVSVFLVSLIFFAIKFREANLKKEKRVLEQKVQERTVEIAKQKEIVEHKNKDITDSINYAKNIQEALLPAKKEIAQIFPDSYVIFKPRDIVSGDFYWIAHKENCTYFAVADCTGHGVPGAFMSLLGIAFLDEIIASNPSIPTSVLLNMLRDNVIDSFKSTGGKDGMDISMIRIDWQARKIQYSGANNPLYFVRNNVLKEYKAQKMPIGYYPEPVPFEYTEIDLSAGDTIYLFSDGYADQFGGPLGKKFKYKALKDLLTSVGWQPMVQQCISVEKSWTDWKGEHEQVDDIILIAIRFSEQTFEGKQLG